MIYFPFLKKGGMRGIFEVTQHRAIRKSPLALFFKEGNWLQSSWTIVNEDNNLALKNRKNGI
jgi:hypothetical protein